MSSTHIAQMISVADYLRIEIDTGERYEFYNGKIKLMPGGTIPHNRICRNVLAQLVNALRDNPKFEVFGSEQKIYLPKFNFYLYPDTVVVSADPILRDEETDAIINPVLIVEVMSPSSEKRDRGTKFVEYSSLDSLKEYALIRQDAPEVKTFFRDRPGQWQETTIEGIGQAVEFQSIEVSLKLVDVYRKVLTG